MRNSIAPAADLAQHLRHQAVGPTVVGGGLKYLPKDHLVAAPAAIERTEENERGPGVRIVGIQLKRALGRRPTAGGNVWPVLRRREVSRVGIAVGQSAPGFSHVRRQPGRLTKICNRLLLL